MLGGATQSWECHDNSSIDSHGSPQKMPADISSAESCRHQSRTDQWWYDHQSKMAFQHEKCIRIEQSACPDSLRRHCGADFREVQTMGQFALARGRRSGPGKMNCALKLWRIDRPSSPTGTVWTAASFYEVCRAKVESANGIRVRTSQSTSACGPCEMRCAGIRN